MATISRSRRTYLRRDQIKPELWALPSWTHPEVVYWYPEWKLVRDCVMGEKEVKAEAKLYLPMLEGMTRDEYEAYLERATFYNFTGRTSAALTGSIFRRKPVLSGIPDRIYRRLENASKDGLDFSTFAQHIAGEIIDIGRVGVLLDLPRGDSTDPKPYFVSYIAENILDWETQEVDGRIQPTMIVLREIHMGRDGTTGQRQYYARYRKLSLELMEDETGRQVWTYVQRVYARASADAELKESDLTQTIIPTNRGKRLSSIPFRFFGSRTNRIDIEKPPMLDIAHLNISHYRSYAHLEHGRFFTGFPIYYVEQSAQGEGSGDYVIGASSVWETPPGSKPGLLEFNGHGLNSLEKALDQKEQQASSLGGRMIGIRTSAVSESNNALKLSERNEQSTLLNVANVLDFGFTELMRIWASFQDVPESDLPDITVKFNKDFLFDNVGAREFRAIQSMYKDGIIPIEVVYEYLRKSDVIPEWMEMDEFKELLEDLDSFPNQPNAEARAEGFSDRKDQLIAERADKDRKLEEKMHEDEMHLQRDQQRRQERSPGTERPDPSQVRGFFNQNRPRRR